MGQERDLQRLAKIARDNKITVQQLQDADYSEKNLMIPSSRFAIKGHPHAEASIIAMHGASTIALKGGKPSHRERIEAQLVIGGTGTCILHQLICKLLNI